MELVKTKQNPFKILDELRWLAHWPLSEVKVLFERYKTWINPLLAPDLYVIYEADFVELFNLHGRRSLAEPNTAERIGRVFAFEVGNEEEDNELERYYEHQKQGRSGMEFDELKEQHDQYTGGKRGGNDKVVDVLEAFSALCMFCEAKNLMEIEASTSLDEKLRFIFSLFDFNETLELTDDEVVMLLASTCRGLSRLGGILLPPSNETLEFVVANMFSFFSEGEVDEPEKEYISLEEFTSWVKKSDVSKQFLSIIESVYAYEHLLHTIRKQMSTIESVQNNMNMYMPFIFDSSQSHAQRDKKLVCEMKAKTTLNLVGARINKSLRMANSNLFIESLTEYCEPPLSKIIQEEFYQLTLNSSGTRIVFGPIIGKVTSTSCESVLVKLNRDAEIICHLGVLGKSVFDVDFCGRNVRDLYSHGGKPSNLRIIRSFPVRFKAQVLSSFSIPNLQPNCQYILFFTEINHQDIMERHGRFSTLQVASAKIITCNQCRESTANDCEVNKDALLTIHLCRDTKLSFSYLENCLSNYSSHLIMGDFTWKFGLAFPQHQQPSTESLVQKSLCMNHGEDIQLIPLQDTHILVLIRDISKYFIFQETFLEGIKAQTLSCLTLVLTTPIVGTPKYTWLCTGSNGIETHQVRRNFILPSGWVENTDPKTRRKYYYNVELQITQWDPPEGTIVDHTTSVEPKADDMDGTGNIEAKMAHLRSWHSQKLRRSQNKKSTLNKTLKKKVVNALLTDLFSWIKRDKCAVTNSVSNNDQNARRVKIVCTDMDESGLFGSGKIYERGFETDYCIEQEVLSSDDTYLFQHPMNTYYRKQLLTNSNTLCESFVFKVDEAQPNFPNCFWHSHEDKQPGFSTTELPTIDIGPLVGKVTQTTAELVLRANATARISCVLKYLDDNKIAEVRDVFTKDCGITQVIFSKLAPNTSYVFSIHGALHLTNNYRLVGSFKTCCKPAKKQEVTLCFINHSGSIPRELDGNSVDAYVDALEKNSCLGKESDVVDFTAVIHLGSYERCYGFNDPGFEAIFSTKSNLFIPKSKSSDSNETEKLTNSFTTVNLHTAVDPLNGFCGSLTGIIQLWKGKTAILYTDILCDNSWKPKISQALYEVHRYHCKTLHIVLDGLILPVKKRTLPKEFENAIETPEDHIHDYYRKFDATNEGETRSKILFEKIEYKNRCQQLLELISNWKIDQKANSMGNCEIYLISPGKTAALSWKCEIVNVFTQERILTEIIVPPIHSDSSRNYNPTTPLPNLCECESETLHEISESKTSSANTGTVEIFKRRNIIRNVMKIGVVISRIYFEKAKCMKRSYIVSFPLVKTVKDMRMIEWEDLPDIKEKQPRIASRKGKNENLHKLFEESSLDCDCMKNVIKYIYDKYLQKFCLLEKELSSKITEKVKLEMDDLQKRVFELVRMQQNILDSASSYHIQRQQLMLQEVECEDLLLQQENSLSDLILVKQMEQEKQWALRWRVLSHLRKERSKLTSIVDLSHEATEELKNYFNEISAIKARVSPKQFNDAVKEYTDNCECGKKLLQIASLSEDAKKLLIENANVLTFDGKLRTAKNNQFDFSAELAGSALKGVAKIFQKQITASITVEEQTGWKFVCTLNESYQEFYPKKKKSEEHISRTKRYMKRIQRRINECNKTISQCLSQYEENRAEIAKLLWQLRNNYIHARQQNNTVSRWRRHVLPFVINVIASFLPTKESDLFLSVQSKPGLATTKCLDKSDWLTRRIEEIGGYDIFHRVMNMDEFVLLLKKL